MSHFEASTIPKDFDQDEVKVFGGPPTTCDGSHCYALQVVTSADTKTHTHVADGGNDHAAFHHS